MAPAAAQQPGLSYHILRLIPSCPAGTACSEARLRAYPHHLATQEAPPHNPEPYPRLQCQALLSGSHNLLVTMTSGVRGLGHGTSSI